MTNTIMQQAAEQVKKAIEVANSPRPLPTFGYMPAMDCEPSYRHAPSRSHRCSDEVRETARPEKNGRSRGKNRDRSVILDALQHCRPSPARPAKLTTTSTPYVTHSHRTTWFEEQEQTWKPRGEVLGWRHTPEHRSVKECIRSPPSGGLREAQTPRKRNHLSGTPHYGFGDQEVNPGTMIRLPLRFGDKAKATNIEVDFLVVNVPMANNVILGRPTLHKVKAVFASYLLHLQFETDDWSVSKL
ncbi:hypothetical protein Cgig2_012362 [Carnegiea gigantea]|uniref:Uncharacterized protein n=1 Tax=Carnegiea gigantea TaxID=171969 RepID=A0A9Q1KMA8_9CARY|nr:hypothetical protein Cgig2_012362 [Carnegiea gigantea]